VGSWAGLGGDCWPRLWIFRHRHCPPLLSCQCMSCGLCAAGADGGAVGGGPAVVADMYGRLLNVDVARHWMVPECRLPPHPPPYFCLPIHLFHFLQQMCDDVIRLFYTIIFPVLPIIFNSLWSRIKSEAIVEEEMELMWFFFCFALGNLGFFLVCTTRQLCIHFRLSLFHISIPQVDEDIEARRKNDSDNAAPNSSTHNGGTSHLRMVTDDTHNVEEEENNESQQNEEDEEPLLIISRLRRPN
jgi:hypothetical protein